jgi:hypothetical protein
LNKVSINYLKLLNFNLKKKARDFFSFEFKIGIMKEKSELIFFFLLWIKSRVSYHDVAVEGDGQNGEDGNGQESVAHEREERAKGLTVDPGPVVEQRRGQR